MILPQSFYLRDDVVQIAKDLLGKVIYTKIDDVVSGGIIVETEAYRAPDDRACHAYNNKLTDRTRTMFMEGGTCYVYISYGIHRMINVVTAEEGKAHAILIRAIEPTTGQKKMALRRRHSEFNVKTVNGPGKTAQALGVVIDHDTSSLFKTESQIWIEDSGISYKKDDITEGMRVGMSHHVGKDAHRPWRFCIKDNKYVSLPRVVKYPEIPK